MAERLNKMAGITVDQLQILVTANTTQMKAGLQDVKTSVQDLGNKSVDMVTSSMGDAINRFDVIQNFPKVMANFGISTDDANNAMKRLVEGVHSLPTSLNSITQLAEGFTPMTKNIGDATTLALAFNDALLASGSPMETQTAAMEQTMQVAFTQ